MGRPKKELLQRFMKHVDKNWQWTGSKTKGYGRLGLNGKFKQAHRISYELFKGPIPDGLFVLHSCDDRGCVNPEHLHIGGRDLNAKEMVDRGRVAWGERHGHAKLTKEQVLEIREQAKNGKPRRLLAQLYNVALGTISDIVSRRKWSKI